MENRALITISHLFHKGEKQIKLDLRPEYQLVSFLKKILGLKWSQTHNCWYILNNPKNLKILFGGVKNIADIDGNNFFRNKTIIEKQEIFFPEKQVLKKLKCPDEYLEKLQLKRYSENTIRTYKFMFEDFINYFPYKKIDDISDFEIKEYQLFLVREKNISESFQNQSINAIKFYYENVKKGSKKFYELERPRKSRKLPVVLSEQEVKQIFLNINNLKHKCLISLIYSGGLRLSEAINLKLEDIDQERKII